MKIIAVAKDPPVGVAARLSGSPLPDGFQAGAAVYPPTLGNGATTPG